MAAERLPVRKLREIIRLKLEMGLSGRAIARSCNISPGTVSGYLARIAMAKLSWPLPPALDDDVALERLLFPTEGKAVPSRPEPDWAWIHQELQKRHVTKLLLWQEYREAQPDGYQFSRFCDLYREWARPLSATMRQVHRAGEKTFFDFSGDGIDVVDPSTGECRKAVLFVAVLGASNLTYVEPVFHQDLSTWIVCHVRAFEYFGGGTEIWVPDNLKAGVNKAHRYDPELNPTYAELARHYDAAILPARPRRPRDKAKVEAAVLIAERWILAVLRNRTFYSLDELRDAVDALMEKLNDRPMRRLKKSRRQLFAEIERGALKPLPAKRFEFAAWARPTVAPNYHVEYEDHFYSVPYQLLGEKLDLRATDTTVEIFQRGTRITSHLRSYVKHEYTTKNEHMPRSHRDHAEWTPQRIIAWAKTVGPQTAALVEGIMAARKHPEHGFNRCLGILSLRKQYADERIERACARALRYRALTYKSVAAILKNNLDREELPKDEPQQPLPLHGNVRGRTYYQ
jgi:transposase